MDSQRRSHCIDMQTARTDRSQRIERIRSQRALSADHHGHTARWNDIAGRRRDRCHAACMGCHVASARRWHLAYQHRRRCFGDDAGPRRHARDQGTRLGHVGCSRLWHLADQNIGLPLNYRQWQRRMRHRRRCRRRWVDRRMTMRCGLKNHIANSCCRGHLSIRSISMRSEYATRHEIAM